MSGVAVDEASRARAFLAGPSARDLADDHLVDDDRQAVDVRPRVDGREPRGLFRAHVPRRAERNPRARELRAARRRAHRLRDAEIGDDRMRLREQHVLRLDVAMQHAQPVRIRERVGDWRRDVDRACTGHASALHDLLTQRSTIDEGHHVVDEPVRLSGIVQRQDVWMHHARDDVDLVQEPFGADRARDVRTQHLERDVAVMLAVVRDVYRRHPAASEDATDLVPVRDRRGELGRHTCRCGRHWRRDRRRGGVHAENIGRDHAAGRRKLVSAVLVRPARRSQFDACCEPRVSRPARDCVRCRGACRWSSSCRC